MSAMVGSGSAQTELQRSASAVVDREVRQRLSLAGIACSLQAVGAVSGTGLLYGLALWLTCTVLPSSCSLHNTLCKPGRTSTLAQKRLVGQPGSRLDLCWKLERPSRSLLTIRCSQDSAWKWEKSARFESHMPVLLDHRYCAQRVLPQVETRAARAERKL